MGVAAIPRLCVAQRKAALCSGVGLGRGCVASLRTHLDVCAGKTEGPLKAIGICSMGMWDMLNFEWRKPFMCLIELVLERELEMENCISVHFCALVSILS